MSPGGEVGEDALQVPDSVLAGLDGVVAEVFALAAGILAAGLAVVGAEPEAGVSRVRPPGPGAARADPSASRSGRSIAGLVFPGLH